MKESMGGAARRMFKRPTIRIPSFDLQRLVQDFTLSPRVWTGYPIDKVEHMMHFYKVLPAGFYYARFDTDTEEVVFQCQPFEYNINSVALIRKDCINLPTQAKLLLSGE